MCVCVNRRCVSTYVCINPVLLRVHVCLQVLVSVCVLFWVRVWLLLLRLLLLGDELLIAGLAMVVRVYVDPVVGHPFCPLRDHASSM